MKATLRVFLLSNQDLTSNIIFSRLFGSPHIQIIGVGFTKTLVPRRRGFVTGSLMLLRKMDWRYWTYLVFVNGAYRLFESLAQCRNMSQSWDWPRALRSECRRTKVPVLETSDINAPEFVDIIRKARPDLLLIRINQVLHAHLLSIPSLGTWCIHSSLLPSYGGIAAELHGLSRGEPILGSTIFRVERELDRGPALFQVPLRANTSWSLFRNTLENNLRAAELLRSSVERLAVCGSAEPELILPRPSESYHSWPVRSDIRRFHSRGLSLIQLEEALDYLVRCIGFGSRTRSR